MVPSSTRVNVPCGRLYALFAGSFFLSLAVFVIGKRQARPFLFYEQLFCSLQMRAANPTPQLPAWRTRVSLFVWSFLLNPPGLEDPAGS